MAKSLRRKKDIAGFNEQSVKTIQTSMQKMLPILQYSFDDELYQLELVTIEPAKILTETIVFEGNEREQSWLNRTSLTDITETLEGENGQLIYPAIGYKRDGKVVIVDGSRRRIACHLAQKNYLVYVSNKAFDNDLAKSLSNISNAHRGISLLEKGLVFKQALEKGVCKSHNDIIRVYGEHKSTVSVAIKSTRLPKELLDSFPAPTFIGKKLIDDLAKLVELIEKSSFNHFSEVTKQAATLISSDSKDPVKLNANYHRTLLDIVNESSDLPAKNDYISLPNNSGQYRVTMNDKSKTLKLELKGVEKKNLDKFKAFCLDIGILL